MKRVAAESGVVRVPVVVEPVPVQHHLAIVLIEVRHVVVPDECIECHLYHCRSKHKLISGVVLYFISHLIQ
jgi:hypothetical protein